MTDEAILAALPATAKQVAATVGLSQSAAQWRLRQLRDAGRIGRGVRRGANNAPVWEIGRGDIVPSRQSARRPVRQAGGLLCLRCLVPTSEHALSEIMRGCAR